MIYQLVPNIPKLVSHFDGVVSIYVRDYGTGNLRLAMDQESLRNTANLAPGGVVDGIPQNAASGVQLYFWSGDLWIISDQADTVVIIAPAYQQYLTRWTPRKPPSSVEIMEVLDPEADLSTYP